jgi:hypothetical protein
MAGIMTYYDAQELAHDECRLKSFIIKVNDLDEMCSCTIIINLTRFAHHAGYNSTLH